MSKGACTMEGMFTRPADAAVAGQISMVKLYEAVTAYDVTQIDAYVGGLNLPGYSEIIIVPRIRMSGGSQIYMSANGIRENIYFSGAQSNNYGMGSFLPYHNGSNQYTSSARTKLCLDFSGDWVVGSMESGAMSSGTIYLSSQGISTYLHPSSITSLNFCERNGGVLLAGSKITIYGVR